MRAPVAPPRPPERRLEDAANVRVQQAARIRLGLQRRARANLQRALQRDIARVATLIAADCAAFVVIREALRAMRYGLLGPALVPVQYGAVVGLISGPWQVAGRNAVTDFETVVGLEQEYIRTWSLAADFRILLRTIPAVLRMRGAL